MGNCKMVLLQKLFLERFTILICQARLENQPNWLCLGYSHLEFLHCNEDVSSKCPISKLGICGTFPD